RRALLVPDALDYAEIGGVDQLDGAPVPVGRKADHCDRPAVRARGEERPTTCRRPYGSRSCSERPTESTSPGEMPTADVSGLSGREGRSPVWRYRRAPEGQVASGC